jgi:hypothetical protein
MVLDVSVDGIVVFCLLLEPLNLPLPKLERSSSGIGKTLN